MLIYRDIISDDEILSDSYPINKIYGGIVYEVKCKYITLNEKIDSITKEESDKTEKVIDVINAFSLQETSFDKSNYTTYIKSYLKSIKSNLDKTNPSLVEDFMKNAAEYVKTILKNFDDYSFYYGSSFNSESMIILFNYKDKEYENPYLYYFRDGLKEEKI
jgi:hypothetical protein